MTTAEGASIHACTVVLGRFGVLIRGESMSGKSMLATCLIDEATKIGKFAGWVADDRTFLTTKADRLVAHCPNQISGLVELHHFGIRKVEVPRAAVIDLVVDLVPPDHVERMPRPSTIALDGLTIPHLLVPAKQTSISAPLVSAALSKIDP